MAILRIFDEQHGSRDLEIEQKRLILGREKDYSDFVLADRTASKMHCMIYQDEDRFYIKDLDSTTGTLVNRHKIDHTELHNHDSIQIGTTVMEFISKEIVLPDLISKEFNSSPEQTLNSLQSSYRPIPRGMGLKARIVYADPHNVFNPGDTVRIGGGGIMTPRIQMEESIFSVIFEMELLWPDGRKKSLHGQVEHDLPSSGLFCIKLHGVSKTRYRMLMEGAKRGSWVLLQKPEEAKGTLL